MEPNVLYVPNLGSDEFIEMEGLTVFKLAVRKMIDMLDQACTHRGMTSAELDYIVPHQANERIIEPSEKPFIVLLKKCSTILLNMAIHPQTRFLSHSRLMPNLPSGTELD